MCNNTLEDLTESELLQLLHAKFRFVDIDSVSHSWTEIDEDEHGNITKEIAHSSITIHLSNIGYSDKDPFFHFDDKPLKESLLEVVGNYYDSNPCS